MDQREKHAQLLDDLNTKIEKYQKQLILVGGGEEKIKLIEERLGVLEKERDDALAKLSGDSGESEVKSVGRHIIDFLFD